MFLPPTFEEMNRNYTKLAFHHSYAYCSDGRKARALVVPHVAHRGAAGVGRSIRQGHR